jgi:hypothetical protein
MPRDESDILEEAEKEEFGGLLKFTAGGFLGGFLLSVLLDYLGFQGIRSKIRIAYQKRMDKFEVTIVRTEDKEVEPKTG